MCNELINQLCILDQSKDTLLHVMDKIEELDISLETIINYAKINKVLTLLLNNIFNLQHNYLTQDKKRILQIYLLEESLHENKLSAIKHEIEQLSDKFIYLKGSVLKPIYKKYYGSEIIRYSKDIDIYFDKEEDFWEFITLINQNDYIQNEALYMIAYNSQKEFGTVHFKKNGIRLDLHTIGFPKQLFNNLNANLIDENYKLENSLLVLLAHSISHERVSIRDINDFHILLKEIKNMNLDYLNQMIINNHFEKVLDFYISAYKKIYNRFPQNLEYKVKKEYSIDDIFPKRIEKKIVYSTLYYGNMKKVLEIRYLDIYMRKLLAKVNKFENHLYIYNQLSKIFLLKNYRFYFFLKYDLYSDKKLNKEYPNFNKFDTLSRSSIINLKGTTYILKNNINFYDKN